MLCIWVRAASTICSGHPSAVAAAAIFSITCLLALSLASAVSLRQLDMALRAAFTASRPSLERPGTETGLKARGVTSLNLIGMAESPWLVVGTPFRERRLGPGGPGY